MPLNEDGWLHKVYNQNREKKKIKDRADILREIFRKETYGRWKRGTALRAGKSYASFLKGEEEEYFRGETVRYQDHILRPINNYKDLARVKIELGEAEAEQRQRQAEIAAEQAAADAAAAAEARRRPRILARERDQHIAQLLRTRTWDVAEALREVRPPPGISQESWLRGDHPQFATEHAVWLRLVRDDPTLSRFGESAAAASLADGMRAATMLRKSKKNKPKKYKPIKYKSKKYKPKKYKPKKSKGKKAKKVTKTHHKTRRKLYRN